MVRYLFNENVKYIQSNGPNTKYVPVNKKGTKTKSFFWNSEAKKPTMLTFILIIAIALSLFIWGIFGSFSSIHVIRVEIEFSDDFVGEIEFQNTYEDINDNMGKEYTYEIREGNEIRVYVYKYDSSETLTVKIYDNGELVREESAQERWSSVSLVYTVGE
jgi:hypothetical protein